jgi:D-glycero-D-manno-heptose 1,7-bisphosphate phosphatase
MRDSLDTKKVIVLDRDGTIVIDRGYLSDPAGLEFLPGAAEGLRRFHEDGYTLIIITNQSGVGRGTFSLDRLEEIHNRLREMMSAIGAPVERIYYCPHVPEAQCDCRKPNVQLMLRAAADLHFEPSGAVVIGDRSSDIELGHRVGARTVLISPEVGDPTEDCRPHFVAVDLLAAARVVKESTINLHLRSIRQSA